MRQLTIKDLEHQQTLLTGRESHLKGSGWGFTNAFVVGFATDPSGSFTAGWGAVAGAGRGGIPTFTFVFTR